MESRPNAEPSGQADVVPAWDHDRRRIRDYWDHRAPSFANSWWNPNRNAAFAARWGELYRNVFGEAPLSILDIGSGPGEVVFLLRELGHDAEGIDFAPAMLELARRAASARCPDARFVEGNAAALPYPDASFDAAHARMVLWTQPDCDATLKEWMRVIKPGGRIAVVEGTWHPRAWRTGLRVAAGQVRRVQSMLTGTEHAYYPPFKKEIDAQLYPGKDVLPHLWGFRHEELGRVLDRAGFVRVESWNLDGLRRLVRSKMPWRWRLMVGALDGACIATGEKPAVG